MSKRAFQFFLTVPISVSILFLGGCATESSGIEQVRVNAAQKIAEEPPGDYFIGHRYFKGSVFKFWGYVRKPGQPWKTAQLVVLNEKEKLAPDRETRTFGSDNNYEYKLHGNFSGQTVYEPASNGFYPEFVLKSYELISTSPAPIFKSQYNDRARAAVGRIQIEKPE
jgi:hypothetical protein